jgi:hypothetical protein
MFNICKIHAWKQNMVDRNSVSDTFSSALFRLTLGNRHEEAFNLNSATAP